MFVGRRIPTFRRANDGAPPLSCFGEKLRLDVDTAARELQLFLPDYKSILLHCDLVISRHKDNRRCRSTAEKAFIDVDVCSSWGRGNVDQSGLRVARGRRRVIWLRCGRLGCGRLGCRGLRCGRESAGNGRRCWCRRRFRFNPTWRFGDLPRTARSGFLQILGCVM